MNEPVNFVLDEVLDDAVHVCFDVDDILRDVVGEAVSRDVNESEY